MSRDINGSDVIRVRAVLLRRAASSLLDSMFVLAAGGLLSVPIFEYVLGSAFAGGGVQAGMNGAINAGMTIGEKIAGGVIFGLFGGVLGGLFAAILSLLLGLFAAGIVVALVEAVTGRAPGALLLGLRVVKRDGSAARVPRLAFRAFLKYGFVPLCLAGLLTGTEIIFALGLLWWIIITMGFVAAFGSARLTLLDRLSGTTVERAIRLSQT